VGDAIAGVAVGEGGITRRRFVAQSGALTAAALVAPGRALESVASAYATGPAHGAPWTFGGELEYYRSDPAHLEARLALCAQAGYTTIQTYVPWNVHENQQGVVDFAGATHPVIVGDHADEYDIETPDNEVKHGGALARVVANTDLQGFLRACVRHGFKVILRPGPFISDEWRNGGLPDWLLQAGFPGMYQQGPTGSPLQPGAPFSPPIANVVGGGPEFYFVGPSYASPFYLDQVARWMRTFAAFAKPWLATNGGPVVSVQVDDEICFYYRFGPFEVDYHPAMLARYRAATGQDPPRDYPPSGGPVAALKPAFAWQRFKAAQLGGFLGTLAADLRSGGVDVPISHEEELQLSPPAGLAQIAGAVDVLNPEFYNGDTGPWSLPLNELCAAAVRAAQRNRRDVVAAELSAGDPFLRYLLFGEGMAGALGFSYTDGIPDDAVEDLTRIGKTIHTAGPRLAQTRRRADTAIVWCPDLRYAPYHAERYGFERDVRGVAERDVPALATMLIRSGLAFDLLDTDVAQARDYRAYPTIWLAASDVLPRAAQANLVRYVRSGGRLVCWPAPPTLDEHLDPCSTLADALFPEARASFYPQDGQQIDALGVRVPVWRGVQAFTLSHAATVIATRGTEPCGYRRRAGRGEALLIGAWPAADSLAGAAGLVLEVQQTPAGSASSAARATTARRLGPQIAAAVAPGSPPGAGPPQYTIVYQYSNERRGSEFIAGGATAYWDGHNVVPVAELNTADGPATTSTPPFRPLLPAHFALTQRLNGRPAQAGVSDLRAQVRVLDSRTDEASTVSAVNRYPEQIDVVIRTRVNRRNVRLPQVGKLRLPPTTGLLMPIDYTLARRLRIVQATVQLLDFTAAAHTLQLDVTSPAGGELVLELPGPLASARVGGRAVRVTRLPRTGGSAVRFSVAGGDQHVTLAWTKRRSARHRHAGRAQPRRRGRSGRRPAPRFTG